MIEKRFLVNLQGKDFVTYEGLLHTAHEKGLIGITTELVSHNGDNQQVIFKATARTEKGEFTGYGDADTTNVNKMIAKHLLRMAETRAKARALRDLTNIGMTAFEELGGEDAEPKKTETKKEEISLDNEITFGKYKGKTYKEVLASDKKYIEYLSSKATDPNMRKFLTDILLKGA